MSRRIDTRLRTICEFCKQWVRVQAEDLNWRVRRHSQPQGGVCLGSGEAVLWTIPKGTGTRGRPAEVAGEDE